MWTWNSIYYFLRKRKEYNDVCKFCRRYPKLSRTGVVFVSDCNQYKKASWLCSLTWSITVTITRLYLDQWLWLNLLNLTVRACFIPVCWTASIENIDEAEWEPKIILLKIGHVTQKRPKHRNYVTTWVRLRDIRTDEWLFWSFPKLWEKC